MTGHGLDVAGSLTAIRLAARTYVDTVLPVVQAHQPVDEREGLLVAYIHRAFGTLTGLAKLDNAAHLQLTFAGLRNLLEVLVDVALVAHRQPDDAVERLQAWEECSLLRAGEAITAHVEGTPERVERLAPVFDFIRERRDEILSAKSRFWPNAKKVPDRWTSRNLLDDCKVVDHFERFDLEDFYQLRVRRNNWLLHGSGFAGIRHLGPHDLESLYCQSLADSAITGFRIALLVLTALGLDPQVRGALEHALARAPALALGHE
jgi:hypothetical protein